MHVRHDVPRRDGFANTEEDDKAKDRSGQRVGDEEDQIVVPGDQSREDRRNRRAQIDRPVVVSIGACPRFRWTRSAIAAPTAGR